MPEQSLRTEGMPPQAISKWGWRYHHLGIPTKTPMPGERYIASIKCYVSGFPTSPAGIEWMRFEPESPVHTLIQRIPHLAFEVPDLARAMAQCQWAVLSPASQPAPGIQVVMLEHNGAPIELLAFTPTQ